MPRQLIEIRPMQMSASMTLGNMRANSVRMFVVRCFAQDCLRCHVHNVSAYPNKVPVL